MKYNYEPLLVNINYQKAVDTFKEESSKVWYECMYEDSPTNSDSYDFWQDIEMDKISLVFEKEYNLITESKTYFFGCAFDVYEKTYSERLNSFLIEFPDAGELDFCDYELEKEVNYIMPELLKLKIGFSIKKRVEFLNEKKARLTTQPQQAESTTEPEPEQKTPYKIALLHELGFFKLDAIKKLNKESQYKIISTLTGGTLRTIKGNILVLDPISNEDRMKYTSNDYSKEVKNYLDKLK